MNTVMVSDTRLLKLRNFMFTKYSKYIGALVLIIALIFILPLMFVCEGCEDIMVIATPRISGNPTVERLYKSGERKKLSGSWGGRLFNKYHVIGKDITNRKVGLFVTNLNKFFPKKVNIYYHKNLGTDKKKFEDLVYKKFEEYGELSNKLWMGVQLELAKPRFIEHSLNYQDFNDLKSLNEKLCSFSKPSAFNFVFFNDFSSVDSKAMATKADHIGIAIMNLGSVVKHLSAELIAHEMTHMKGSVHEDNDVNYYNCNVVNYHTSCCKLTSYLENVISMTAGIYTRGALGKDNKRLTKHGCVCEEAHEHDGTLCQIHPSAEKLGNIPDRNMVNELDPILRNDLGKNFKDAMSGKLEEEYDSLFGSDNSYWSRKEYVKFRLSNIIRIRALNYRRAVAQRLDEMELIYTPSYLESRDTLFLGGMYLISCLMRRNNSIWRNY